MTLNNLPYNLFASRTRYNNVIASVITKEVWALILRDAYIMNPTPSRPVKEQTSQVRMGRFYSVEERSTALYCMPNIIQRVQHATPW